jgi:hypothetical protein
MKSTTKPNKTIDLGLTEHQIQNQCIQYLKLKGFYVIRLNSGVLRASDASRTRLIRMAAAGTPDVMAFKQYEVVTAFTYREILFLEIKRPGKNPTPIQEQKMAELETYGAKCLVIHSLEELEQLI